MRDTADDIIDRVYHRLSNPDRWHGDPESRNGDFSSGGGLDADGHQVPAISPTAVRHCAIGAIKAEARIPEGIWPLPDQAGIAFARIAAAAGWPCTDNYNGKYVRTCRNDTDGYQAVIAAVRAARAPREGRRHAPT